MKRILFVATFFILQIAGFSQEPKTTPVTKKAMEAIETAQQDQLDGGIFLYSVAQTYFQLNFLISYSVSMDKERPKWNDGKLF